MWKEDEKFRVEASDRTPSSIGRATLELARIFDELALHAPAGYSAGLHIRFASPLVYVRTYTEEWLKLYDERAYALRDPIVFWGLALTGHARWSAIRLADPFSIFGQAARHGLKYGVVFSTGPLTSRSIVGLARSDREYTDAEIGDIAPIVARLHTAAEPPTGLTKAQIEALRLLANGDRHAAAAARLGISESALKARLQAARSRLGARTTAEALKKARDNQLL